MTSPLRDTLVRLLKRRPFYAHLALSCLREERTDRGVVGITLRGGSPVIFHDPRRFASHGALQQEALVEHLMKHLLHLHMLRGSSREGVAWDAAADLAINDTIEGLPPDAPRPIPFGLPPSLSAEEYYDLLHDPFDTGSLQGSGAGQGGEGETPRPDPAAIVPVDDHQSWNEAEGTTPLVAEAMLRSHLADALRLSDGVVPADLRERIDEILSPRSLPWQIILRQFIAQGGRLGRESTWMREHRRFEHQTPGVRKRRRLRLLVGVDVSESTDTHPLRESFAAELTRIARARESEITVVYTNSRVQTVEHLRGRGVRVEIYRGGGFTDLRPLFAYARSMVPPPSAVIYLTDGRGTAPPVMEFPTLWVLTPDGVPPAPWGVILRLS